MALQYIGYGGNEPYGPYLRKSRAECIRVVQPKSEWELRNNVTGCIFDKFTEFDKSLYASSQYVLTLWPAFIGAIVALAPDPSIMVFDNIWWAGLFGITSGGMPGLDISASPPHHIEVHSEIEGRKKCETWSYDAFQPKKMSKGQAMGSSTRGAGHIRMEWVAFLLGCGLWLAFCVYFGHTLRPAVSFTFEGQWLKSAVWYYISISPAILACVFEALQNRVDLYEPIDDLDRSGQNPDKREVLT